MKKHLLLPFLSLALISLNACKKDDPTPEPQPTPVYKPFELTKNGTSEIGELCVAYYPWATITDSTYLMVLDGDGNVLKSKTEVVCCTDFKRWTINGENYYSYLRHNPQHYRIPGAGYVNGDIVILDNNMNEVKTIQLLPHNGRGASDPVSLGGHEFILIDLNHYIVQAYYKKEVSNVPASLNPYNNINVVDCIIQEVNNGSVVMEWDAASDSLNYLGYYAPSEFSDSTITVDFAHLNSISIDPTDQNLLVSFRNLDQVMKINRTTGAIMWRLGGTYSDFQLSANQVFLRQHYASRNSEGNIMLFDNGDLNLRAQSRVVEFGLDETNKTVTTFKSMDVPDNVFGRYMGSVQKVNGRYIVGCGSVGRIFEMDATTGEVYRDFKSTKVSYRAQNFN
ncbi:MAG: hypothetical protein EP332_08965 [Bacteroidetes bacterium]|nr:MAG: hypothetical protein EP332_08965 [Bacteroidota bacterium]